MTEWETYVPDTRWTVGFETLTLSHLSTEYVLIPIQVTKAGVPYNPTSDTLQFAFMPNSVQVPITGDWVSGVWETVATNIIYPYNAKCLVGPTGSTVLTLGTYVIYLKITDNPETPVLVAGQLVIS
jgi:hypothetical protein